MRDLISASQVRSGVSMVPKYLKVLVKGMELVPSFRVSGGGLMFLFICVVACVLVAGKYMASVFDLVPGDPTCI